MMLKRANSPIIRLVAFLSFLAISSNSAFAQVNVDSFDDFSAQGLPGRLFIPPEAANEARPVMVFLHGLGETGTNNTAQINGNLNNLLTAAKERGAFLYAPQATTTNWTNRGRTDAVMAMVDEIVANQNADSDRLYVTGLSMGGGGSWNLASRYSDRIAANVPIAGVAPASDFSPQLMLDVPTWAFHARNDNVVSVNRSRERVNQILTAAKEPIILFAGGTDTLEFSSDNINLKYTEWPTGGHGIWGRVYNTPAMYDWMFTQSVPEPTSGFLIFLAFGTALLVRRRRQDA